MNDAAEMFKKLAGAPRSGSLQDRDRPKTQEPELTLQSPPVQKRGRPATGKRSDPDWSGRTFYIRKETDLDIEAALLELKRQGVELDKSELVDALLSAWLKWRQGENVEIYLSEISLLVKS